MSLFVAVLFVLQAPVRFTPERVGVRCVQSLPYGDAETHAPWSDGWTSSPGATMAQTAAGLGCYAVAGGVGFVLVMGNFINENYEALNLTMPAVLAFTPAAAAGGVVWAGAGRGRAGRAFLGSYVGAVALGTVGLLLTHDFMSGGIVGAAVGSLPGAVVGYNLR